MIKYLHRTARDFLEEDARWTDILSHTRNTSLEPYLSLMGANSLILRRTCRVGAGSSASSASLQSQALKAITCASYADVHAEYHEAQISILDDIDNLMTAHSGHGTCWHYCLGKIIPVATGPEPRFTDLAVLLNLSGYITAKLREEPLELGAAAKLLLYRRLEEPWNRGWDMTAPTLNIRMAAALVTLGTDVNCRGGQFSAWELCLSWLCEELVQDSAPLEEESFKDYRSVFRSDPLPIMKCMILSGADPHAVVSVAQ